MVSINNSIHTVLSLIMGNKIGSLGLVLNIVTNDGQATHEGCFK